MTNTAPLLDSPDGITFLHISTEDSANYYFTLPGLLDEAAITAILDQGSLDSYGEEGLWYLEHVERVPRGRTVDLGPTPAGPGRT